ncbi:MAG TPA: serine/threonine-protein kinase, partial [Tepidisphaeraceae bacterium]|nr:serine/threonine-protein kinase [Tepidisphaeraceae bacterium]
MWTYTYKHGDRPLDGYTVQRAAGRGGFGEVYYAVSDAGREVALKAITGYEQIELRGIRQCMNLKSPHLVTIFDVRQNEQGRPFVIMEYVNGPNLRQILDDNPAGVGEQKAAFFLREIAKGLSYLHDNGIVHRDLKPANIFFEDGVVKIGDYGLSKAIATTQHSAQTVTVGTVHYMAPEVGQGKYDQGIDIYALGALLYELLTGVVPHVGSTPTEVLMKHLSAEPDLRNVSEPFATAIRRAMAKDPTQRFASVQEMVEAVFGAEHVRQSVSVFSPTDLSMVAGRVARNIGGGAGLNGGVGATATNDADSFTPSSTGPRDGDTQDFWNRFARLTDVVGDQLRGGRFSALRMSDTGQPARDPLLPRHRIVMGAVATGLFAIGAGLVTRSSTMLPFVTMAFSMLAAWAGAFAGLMVRRLVLPKLKQESPRLQKLASGALIGGAVVIASLPAWATSGMLGGSVIAVAVALACMDVRRWTATDRDERVIWDAAGYAAIIALMLSAIFDGSIMISIITAVNDVL